MYILDIQMKWILFLLLVVRSFIEAALEDSWWCVVLLKRHTSIVRLPGRQPGATPTNNLPEQGLTL